MGRYFRELGEHQPGTRDFDPRIALTALNGATGVSGATSDRDGPQARCASLYDAIRDMTAYGSEKAAENRVSGTADIVPKPNR